jgi:hypothetical protein
MEGPAITGKHFGDMPALATLRKRLGELASRKPFLVMDFTHPKIDLARRL